MILLFIIMITTFFTVVIPVLFWIITGRGYLDAFETLINNTLDLLYTTCKGYCEKNDLNKRMPMVVFDMFISQLKKGLEQ